MKMISFDKLSAWRVVMVFAMLATSACGTHPTPLSSSQDIKRASSNIEKAFISHLSARDHSLLSKFPNLAAVTYKSFDGKCADDAKLEALSKVNLKRLKSVVIINAPSVTDAGIQSLSQMPAIRLLGLEGTSITDKSLEIMATEMKIEGVNVSNCSNVTLSGLLKLSSSEILIEFSFSVNSLTQEQVEKIVRSTKNIKWMGIVDPENKLDADALLALAKEKGIALTVREKGALQTLLTSKYR